MTTNKTTKTAFLQIKNFTKSFGETKVLKGVDLDINKGEVVSIIGSSGSGKTTLLRCVIFLEKVDDGIMVLDGETLINGGANEKEDVLRKKRLNFGLVFQSFNLFPQYNVLQNITLAPLTLLNEKIKNYKLSLKGLSFKKKREKIKLFKQENINQINEKCLALLETIGLTDKKNAYPCELSGGQCQRVAIARALALEPKVLCFDEPTSALDPELTGEVLRVIKELKNKDRTMIIVTHEMGFAKNVSDKIVFMSDGVIEEVGTPIEVVENPKSEKLKHFLQSVSSKDGE